MHTNKWSSIALTTLTCVTVAQAQSQTTGAIRGTVRAKQKDVITDASLVLLNLESGITRTCKTDSKGAYNLGFLPVGSYELTVTAPGMKSMKNSNLQVTLGEASIQNFSLDTVEATQVVEIVGQSSSVDSTQINTATSITPDLVEAVPINGRNFTDLVQLTPGASAGGTGNDYRTTVEGARGITNNLQIDGASYNNKFNGEQRGGTRVPFSFGQDSIRELQIITNAFDAQYGDASGAIINAVTKSGTNDYGGMVMVLARPSGLIADVKPVPYDPDGKVNAQPALKRDFSQRQFAFNVGGPIIKDKVHFFINGEYLKWRQMNMPTVALQQGDVGYDTFWNSPTGMGSNLITSSKGLTLSQESHIPWYNDLKNMTLFGRLDWAVNDSHRLVVRINSQNYKAENDTWNRSVKNNAAESYNSRLEITTLSTVLELTSMLSPSLVNEARVQISSENRPKTPNTTISSSITVGGLSAGQYPNDPSNDKENSLQFMDNMSWMSEDWQLKGGFDLQYINITNDYLQYQNGSWSFGGVTSANAWWGDPGNVTSISYRQNVSTFNGHVEFKEKLLAGYVQGQYTGFFNKRLNLSLGARYTREMWENNPLPNPRMQGLDHMPDSGNLDPRLGFTFDVFGNSKTVIRGGYGSFTVSNPAQNAATALTNNGQNTLPYQFTWSTMGVLFAPDALLGKNTRVQSGSLKPLTRAELNSALQYLIDQNLSATGALQAMIISPDAKMAQSRVFTVGVEQDMGNGLVLGAKLTYKRFYHLQYWMDINLGQVNPVTGLVDANAYYKDGYSYAYNKFNTNTRPCHAVVKGRYLNLQDYGQVFLSKYDGEGRYRGLILEANRRSDKGFGFKSSITLQKAEDTNSNERSSATNSFGNPTDPSHPLTMTRSDSNVPFRLIFTGYSPRIVGIKISGTFTYSNGYPFTPRYYDDINGDSFFNDPVNALGGRNAMRQPNRKTFDLRVARTFRLPRHISLEGILDVYNVFNWANQTTTLTSYAQGVGSTPYTSFGLINTNDDRTREVQFTLKARF